MANAKYDNNQIPTMLGTSNADGETPILIKADLATNSVLISDNTSGSDLSDDIASRDDNGNPVMMVVSTDGITPIAIYADPTTGALLTKST